MSETCSVLLGAHSSVASAAREQRCVSSRRRKSPANEAGAERRGEEGKEGRTSGREAAVQVRVRRPSGVN